MQVCKSYYPVAIVFILAFSMILACSDSPTEAPQGDPTETDGDQGSIDWGDGDKDGGDDDSVGEEPTDGDGETDGDIDDDKEQGTEDGDMPDGDTDVDTDGDDAENDDVDCVSNLLVGGCAPTCLFDDVIPEEPSKRLITLSAAETKSQNISMIRLDPANVSDFRLVPANGGVCAEGPLTTTLDGGSEAITVTDSEQYEFCVVAMMNGWELTEDAKVIIDLGPAGCDLQEIILLETDCRGTADIRLDSADAEGKLDLGTIDAQQAQVYTFIISNWGAPDSSNFARFTATFDEQGDLFELANCRIDGSNDELPEYDGNWALPPAQATACDLIFSGYSPEGEQTLPKVFRTEMTILWTVPLCPDLPLVSERVMVELEVVTPNSDTCCGASCMDCTDEANGDGIECTVGACEDEVCNPTARPAEGYCFDADGSCLADGESPPDNPCRECRADQGDVIDVPTIEHKECNDNDQCSSDDHCQLGVCIGTPYSCDTGKPCTESSCNGEGDCLQEIILDGWCLIDGVCKEADAPNPENGCLICRPDRNPYAWMPVPEGESCDDSDLCTSSSVCRAGQCVAQGTPRVCEDDLVCTQDGVCTEDGCDFPVLEGYCLIDGRCWNDLVVNPFNSCQICDAGELASDWSNRESSCNDFEDCTTNDHCEGGECVGDTTPHVGKRCAGNDLYWVDSCGNPEEVAQQCDPPTGYCFNDETCVACVQDDHCEPHQQCTAEYTCICNNECDPEVDEDFCADEYTSQSCDEDRNGCLFWALIDCPGDPGLCLENGACDECDDECESGTKECLTDMQLRYCGQSDPDICTEWVTRDCGVDEYCLEGNCLPRCGDELCADYGDYVENCDTCPTDCDCGDLVCRQGACVSLCGIEGCQPDEGENCLTCPADCGCQEPLTCSESGECTGCTEDSQCPADGWLDQRDCAEGDVVDTYSDWSCVDASCQQTLEVRTRLACASGQICQDASCVLCGLLGNICCYDEPYCDGDSYYCDGNNICRHRCGNHSCESEVGEDCSNCPEDCGCEGVQQCVRGICVDCEDGLCCEDGSFKPSSVVCNFHADEEYRCDGNECGTVAQKRSKIMYCSGNSADCDGNEEWQDWEENVACATDQICESDHDGSWCTTCSNGCEYGSCCECSTGPCCDGCHYKDTGIVCDSEYNASYRCSSSECGADAEWNRSSRYCSGDSASCLGEIVELGWQSLAPCGVNEVCVAQADSAYCEDCPSGCYEGQCCECSTGDCCDGCHYRDSAYVCNEGLVVEYSCTTDQCGASPQRTREVQYCSGDNAACTGSTELLDPELLDVCSSEQICSLSGGLASCVDCPNGCENGECCECSGGACCSDGCHFDDDTTVCNAEAALDFRCSGDGCGADAEKNIQQRFCSGVSAACDGALAWQGWTVSRSCTGEEVCRSSDSDSWCVYCPSGCESGNCCECTSGACCSDGCNFDDTDVICESEYLTEYQCADVGGSGCGGNTQYRKWDRHCPGNAPSCSGASTNNDWQTISTCHPGEICMADDNGASCHNCPEGCQNGQCCECSSGPCCDGCHFKTELEVCNPLISTEYRCEGSGCGADAQSRTRKQYCSGYADSCNGQISWTDWADIEICGDNQYCEDSGSFASCVNCPNGCQSGQCCECDTGACCSDGCHFDPPTLVCNSGLDFRYSCSSGECGADPQKDEKVQYCPGGGSNCDGVIGWTGYVTFTTCDNSEICESNATNAWCNPCQHGCRGGQCCECSSGSCCSNNCDFDNADTICDSSYQAAYQCVNTSGSGCGGELQKRVDSRKCTGDSEACTGEVITGSWVKEESCGVVDYCNASSSPPECDLDPAWCCGDESSSGMQFSNHDDCWDGDAYTSGYTSYKHDNDVFKAHVEDYRFLGINFCSLEPKFEVSGFGSDDLDLYTWYVCDDGSTPSISCSSGATKSTCNLSAYGLSSSYPCCKSLKGSGQNDSVRIDPSCSSNHDDGWVYINVYGYSVSTCTPYTLSYLEAR